MMTIPLPPIPVPLHDDETGGLRVGDSRVSLDSVLAVRDQGGTAEDIVQAFDTLSLADVHAVLAWALLHPEEITEYLARREKEAVAIRARTEQLGHTSPPGELKAKLLARQKAGLSHKAGNASVSD